MNEILLIGHGGHAKSIVDSIEHIGLYKISGFVAEKMDCYYEYRNYHIVGMDDDLEALYKSGIRHAFICVGYMGKGRVRDILYEKLRKIGYILPSIIDPSAIIASDAVVKEGAYIGKAAVVNAGAVVGRMAVVNTGAVIEHDCIIGDYSHIAVNATLCGGVSVGTHCLVGANATVIQEIAIGENTVIGANSTILKDLPGNQTVVGISGHKI